MGESKIEKLKRKRDALDARLRDAEQKEKGKARKHENKRKYLLGAMLMAWMESDEDMKRTVIERMDQFLVRKSDRRYFGMAPRDEPAKPEPEPNPESEASFDKTEKP